MKDNANGEMTYIRDEGNHPIGAVAVRRVGDGRIRLAVSKCHPNDRFDKAVARNRALGRLNSDRFYKEFSVNSSEIPDFLSTYRLTYEQVDRAQKFIAIHSTPKEASA